MLRTPVVQFSWIFLVASKNPADSGESDLLLLPFAMPWIALLPTSWAGLPTAAASYLTVTAAVSEPPRLEVTVTVSG